MIDRTAVEAAVQWADTRMKGHAGELELLDVTDEGVVTVAFGGMCCGCPYKALTFNGTVRPALESVPGVSRVDAAGARISEEAARRLAALTGVPAAGPLSASTSPDEGAGSSR